MKLTTHARGTLIGKGGLRLSFGQWYPEGEPRGLVVLVHGYGEHLGRYEHVIGALTGHGFAVFGLDHRGHGLSEGTRAHVERFDDFVEDLHLVVQEARDAHPVLPLFMVGHSMGSLIALRYALRHESLLHGLVVSGAALQVGDNVSPLLKAAGDVLSAVAPKLPVVPGEENVLSRDPAVERRLQADPLCYNGPARARLANELYRASIRTRAEVERLTLPMLIMHGAADRYTNPQGSILLYERARSGDKELKLWDNNWHEIFNDLDKEQVIAHMVRWLEARSGNEDRSKG